MLATSYMMRFLVSNSFSTFSDLKKFIPDEGPLHPVAKTKVIPMKILFRDEKYISETIEILTKLVEDAKLCGEPQVNTIVNPQQLLPPQINSLRLLWETSSHAKILKAVNYGDRVKNTKRIPFMGTRSTRLLCHTHTVLCHTHTHTHTHTQPHSNALSLISMLKDQGLRIFHIMYV